jgi:FKBP-type peptidyl-prolyl cis-trans isomerase
VINNKFSFFSIRLSFCFSSKALFIFIICVALFSCKKTVKTVGGFTLNDDNIYVRYCEISDEDETPEKNDWLLLNVNYKTQNDSVFFTSRHHSWNGYFFKFGETKNKPLLKFMEKMAVGDSAQIMLNPVIFFNEIFDSGSPDFVAGDSIVKIEMKLMAIMEGDEKLVYEESKRLECGRKKDKERQTIQEYANKKFKQFVSINDQLIYKKTKYTNDSLVKKGKQVSVRFRGFFLDDFLFDHSCYEKPFDFTYGSEGQLLPGLQIVLKEMREGEVAKIILPSQLAFGEEGSSNGFIPPHTPLVYEIEVLNVK